MATLKLFKTHPSIDLPRKQTAQSACFDLSFQGHGKREYKGYTSMNKPFTRVMNNQITISPRERVMVPTGIIMDIPEGYSVRLHARSGLSLKQGLVLANAEGVVDSDYVEEVMVLMTNLSENTISIQSGDRVAQAELVKDAEYTVVESAVRPGVKTTRTGGMGSTGVTSEGNTITLNINEPKIPDFIKQEPPVKRGRGRPRKDAVSS